MTLVHSLHTDPWRARTYATRTAAVTSSVTVTCATLRLSIVKLVALKHFLSDCDSVRYAGVSVSYPWTAAGRCVPPDPLSLRHGLPGCGCSGGDWPVGGCCARWASPNPPSLDRFSCIWAGLRGDSCCPEHTGQKVGREDTVISHNVGLLKVQLSIMVKGSWYLSLTENQMHPSLTCSWSTFVDWLE